MLNSAIPNQIFCVKIETIVCLCHDVRKSRLDACTRNCRVACWFCAQTHSGWIGHDLTHCLSTCGYHRFMAPLHDRSRWHPYAVSDKVTFECSVLQARDNFLAYFDRCGGFSTVLSRYMAPPLSVPCDCVCVQGLAKTVILPVPFMQWLPLVQDGHC